MTSNTLTPDEAKAKHILVMGEELGSIYDALWQQVTWLHRKWSEYVVLFGTKESRVALLNEAAPSFSRIAQDSLWEDVLLHVARLTDPPKSAGKANLSLQTLAPLISQAETKAVVEARMAEALAASEFCRDWRNRHIAHRDLLLALERGAEPLKPASRTKVADALNALAAVLNAVSAHYYAGGTTRFDFGAEHDGAMSLLYVLDSGRHAERARRERLKSGIYDPTEYRPRDL
jgi:hypothetical protein